MTDCCVPGDDTTDAPQNTEATPTAETGASATPAKTTKAAAKAGAKSGTSTRTAKAANAASAQAGDAADAPVRASKTTKSRSTKGAGAGVTALPGLEKLGADDALDAIESGDSAALDELAAWPKNPFPPVTFDPKGDPYFVTVPEGVFLMGGADDDANTIDGEGPVRPVFVKAFQLTATHVTNAQFAKFVEATGYVTECEEIGWSYLFAGLLKGDKRKEFMIGHSDDTAWWLAARTVNWRTPQGPGTTWEEFADHPVVHVSLRDAEACAEYYGGRLVTEAEWEKAARGGILHARYPWGNQAIGAEGASDWRANIWQGKFPIKNTEDDGFYATSPVTNYAPNAMGFYDMAGNVWDWTADWYSTRWHLNDNPETRTNPKGPGTGQTKVIRGGSYLCHDSYCNRYRVAARTSTPADSSTGHLGFRIARDA
ncbi:formylglycine-generating enzyme family protein [Micrococcales bacterium 31B]|nr:formylglycine-generating enzyme family protein [Micrococcales bacterium 31B]